MSDKKSNLVDELAWWASVCIVICLNPLIIGDISVAGKCKYVAYKLLLRSLLL